VGRLADSTITKRALAGALKELMETQSFSQISVLDICEKCRMNRKSFYYHFKDKYDLVNWIYDTEFVTVVNQKEYDGDWELMEDICQYFYDNRNFYRKTFVIEGQNSFSDYFRDVITLIINKGMQGYFRNDDSIDFFLDFYADAFVCAVKRWISQKDCIPAKEFSCRLKRCLIGMSDRIEQEFPDE